jgi:DNA-binding NarL/FixJ family response regulator
VRDQKFFVESNKKAVIRWNNAGPSYIYFSIIRKEAHMKPIKLIIVEDHSVLRETLKIALNMEHDFEIVGDWPSAEAALESMDAAPFDVALLDRMLPGLDGVGLTKKLKEMRPDSKIIMLSMVTEEKKILEAFEAGVSGYVPKQSPISELIDTIKKVASGQMVISQGLTESLIMFFTKTKDDPRSKTPLSDEQLEMLNLAADGLTNKEIATKLDLPLPIVKKRFREMFQILDANHRTHAIVKAAKLGLIHIEQ